MGAIAGANGPTYTFQAVSGDNNAMFSVQVAKVGAALTSRSAKLTVVPDTAGPQILEVISPGLTNITVRFNERVELFGSTDPINYQLSGQSGLFDIVAATREADGSTVTLTPVAGQQLTAGATYEIRVESVTDLGLLPIDPNPTMVSFIAGSAAPRLSIRRSGNQAVLAWPVSASGYVLEQTDALATPVASTVWTPVGITPTVAGGRNNVSVAAGSGIKLFRLRR